MVLRSPPIILTITLHPTINTAACPAKFACAVMWSRESTSEPIRVISVWDFGFLPLPHRRRKHFEAEILGGLPPVNPEQWSHNRYCPVLPEQVTPGGEPSLDDVGFVNAALKYVQGLWPPQSRYVMSKAVFASEMVASYLHNLPREAPQLENFTLDLGALFYAMVCTDRT